MTRLYAFLLCVDRLDAPGGLVWAVRYRGRWHVARRVLVLVPARTVFRGRRARQPKAYLAGRAVLVRRPGRVLMLSAGRPA